MIGAEMGMNTLRTMLRNAITAKNTYFMFVVPIISGELQQPPASYTTIPAQMTACIPKRQHVCC
jgi:hypothetical protein